MIPTDPSLTFALTLKRWFASNDWPQKVTDDWAHATSSQSGPWASQVCNAMKAAGYNPKAEFFLSLGAFNKAVAEQDLVGIADTRLKERLTGATALCLDNGQPYGGAEFWSLYAGLIDPPEAFAPAENVLTQDAVDEWVRVMRENFRQISLKHMCTRAEAWTMLKDQMIELGDLAGNRLSDDDLDYIQEMLAGLVEPTVEIAGAACKEEQEHAAIAISNGCFARGTRRKKDITDRVRRQAVSHPLFVRQKFCQILNNWFHIQTRNALSARSKGLSSFFVTALWDAR